MSDMDEFKASFRRLAELRQARDKDKKAAEKSEKTYREKEAELFAELEEAGIRGRLTFDFGGDLGTYKFQRRTTVYGRVLDKATALASLKKAGLDDVIYSESVNQGRLNEKVRDWLESGEQIPDGLDFYPRNAISISTK